MYSLILRAIARKIQHLGQRTDTVVFELEFQARNSPPPPHLSPLLSLVLSRSLSLLLSLTLSLSLVVSHSLTPSHIRHTLTNTFLLALLTV